MLFAWISRQSSSRSSSDPEAGSTPLESILRFSTETQRRNGFRQSNLPDRGDRILEDIQSGNYTCSICLDAITSSSREYNIWHCRECYNVYHIQCVKAWSEASSQHQTFRSFLALPKWKCPSCSVECDKPKGTCWCGKNSMGLPYISTGRPNACPETCSKAGVCPHGQEKLCLKLCHPGPCDIPCSTSCGGRPFIPKLPTCWNRFWTRVHERERRSARNFLLFFTVLAIIYAALGILLSYHIPWWSKPFKYPGFSSSGAVGEEIFLTIFGIFGGFGVIILLILLYGVVADFFISTLNLDSVDTKPRRKLLTKFWGGLLLTLICLGIFALPFVGFAGGPGIAWHNQMKDSCNGLNTRVSMDRFGTGGSKPSTIPTAKFKVHSLSPYVSSYNMYLGSHLKPVIVPIVNGTRLLKPYEYYERLSVERDILDFSPQNTTEKEFFAIDVDLRYQIYRMIRLDQQDVENQFIAHGYKNSMTSVPSFQPHTGEIIDKGTFTKPNSTYKHMHIPDLNIAIANMYGFVNDCEQEPFVKVYQNINDEVWGTSEHDEKFTATLNEPWDSKKSVPMEHNLVMRTASFGHGRQGLDMCMQEELIEDSGSFLEAGVYEDMFVPFAIMAAYRKRAYETGSRSFNC